jgi:hypothetical protein
MMTQALAITMSPPVDLSDPTHVGYSQTIAVNSSNTAVMAWTEYDMGTYLLRASICSFGLWGTPQTLCSDNRNGFDDARLAIDSYGKAVVVWGNSYWGTNPIQASVYDPVAGAWGLPMMLSSPDVHGSDVKVAIDGSGNAFVVWSQIPTSSDVENPQNGSNCSIWYSILSGTSGNWSPSEPLTDGSITAKHVQLAVNGAGQAIAAWIQYDMPIESIHTVIYQDGQWQNTSTLSTPGYKISECCVGIDGGGNAMAVWPVSDPELGTRIWSASYAQGVWAIPKIVINKLMYSSNFQFVINEAGNGLLAWDSANGSMPGIRTKPLRDGIWSAIQSVSSPTESCKAHTIAINQGGDAAVLWMVKNDYSFGMATCSNGVWSPPQSITSGDGGPKRHRIALSDQGVVFAAWTRTSQSGEAVTASCGSINEYE